MDGCANGSHGTAAPEVEELFDLFSKEENSEIVVEGGGLEELLVQMNANIHCQTLATHCLGCLWNFAMISGHGLIFCLQGGLNVISSVLQQHASHFYIHARALTGLLHVVSTAEYIEDSHVDSIVSSVMFGLRIWGQDKYICDIAYRTLSCLIEKQRSSAQSIVQMNAIPTLVDTLGFLVTQCQQKQSLPTSYRSISGSHSSRISLRPCSYPQLSEPSTDAAPPPSCCCYNPLNGTSTTSNVCGMRCSDAVGATPTSDVCHGAVDMAMPSATCTATCPDGLKPLEGPKRCVIHPADSNRSATPDPSPKPNLNPSLGIRSNSHSSCNSRSCCTGNSSSNAPRPPPTLTRPTGTSPSKTFAPLVRGGPSSGHISNPSQCTVVPNTTTPGPEGSLTGSRKDIVMPCGAVLANRPVFWSPCQDDQLQQCAMRSPVEDIPRIVDDKQSREVLFKALHCIFQLTCCDAAKTVLCNCRAPHVLVQCLQHFPNCERVSLAACGALWNLAMLEHNRTPMRQAGCLEALLSVLSPKNSIPTSRGQRQKLVLRAATALYHLTRFHDDNLMHIVRHKGCEAVVAATREFEKDVAVLQMLSLLLLRLVQNLTQALSPSCQAITHGHSGVAQHLYRPGNSPQSKQTACALAKCLGH